VEGERDPIHGRDSFVAFKEVLFLTHTHGVNIVLLSGDLFQENKPSSRKRLHMLE
jgi:double-strand break repair protein MRE11